MISSVQVPFSAKRTNQDFHFIIGSFFFLTILALFYGVRSSVYYSFEGISTYWFHLSYHYLASGWTWVLMLPMLIGLRKLVKSNVRFTLWTILLALPISAFHRFFAFFFDATFRWGMGYTKSNPIEIWSDFEGRLLTGVFDSFLTYVLVMVAIFLYYARREHLSLETEIMKPELASSKPKRIVAKKNGRFVLLDLADISAFKTEGNYLKVFNEGGWVIIRETAKNMEEKLDPSTFFRVSRSSIINVNFVQDLEPYFNGEYSITMKDGSVFRTGKSFRKNIDRLFGS